MLVLPPGPRPTQDAQLVWRHAVDASDPLDDHDMLAIVLDLLRTAHHDVATASQALAVGRNQVREHPLDLQARRATTYLVQAIGFMGIEFPTAADESFGEQ